MTNAPLLEIRNVYKKYGYRTILRDISFSVSAGECILLLGHNGAGKTSLTRLICALSQPNHGTLYFKGQPFSQSKQEVHKSIGVISHSSRLYHDLNAWENLKVFGTLYGVSQLKQKISKVLEMVELTSATYMPVYTFSSGMLKRLMIARIMLYKPELLILDEPYTGLDPHFVKMLQIYLKNHIQQGNTAFLITHQLSLGLEIATRGLLLHQQQVQQDVPISDLPVEQWTHFLENAKI
ncbi:MAG: heme ABC exporter ATP-binding protein CcmA [SAR324 cluster bacterium]|nr:heme ABC exporter ATP-binding protein CcmA [SAR324 cluster bacterium]